MRSHFPITIDRFRGIYNKGVFDGTGGYQETYLHNYDCPQDHAIEAENVQFIGYGQPQTRMRFAEAISLEPLTNVVRVLEYRVSPLVTHYLVLTYDGVNGRIYKHTDTATPILGPIAGMSDFSVCTMFGRCYISPHDRSFGIDYVYVWDGTNPVRKAALNNTGFIGALTVANGAAGNIELGDHVFLIAYESQSGYIGLPHSGTIFTASGQVSCDVTNIPIGPTGTVARHILVSKIVLGNWTPSQQITFAEIFYLPGTMGKVNDNVTTFKNGVNFYDSELIRSADYLRDQLQEIPSGVSIGSYGNRLLVTGATKSVFGPFAIPAIVPKSNQAWISKPGEPESFDATDGFVQVQDTSYGGIKNNCALNGNLYLFRDSATHSTRDNGDSPSTWGVETVDGGLGAGCFAVATITSGLESTSDVAVVGTRNGLFLFNGSYAQVPISWKVSGLWDAILKSGTNITDFYKMQVAVVPGQKSIFISQLPTNSIYGDPTCKLMCCDYTHGFGFEDVEWSLWSTARAPSGTNTRLSILSIASEINFGSTVSTRSSLIILAKDSTQIATQQYGIMHGLAGPDQSQESGWIGPLFIPWRYRLGYTQPDEESNIQHFTGVRIYTIDTTGGSTGLTMTGTLIGYKVGGETLTITTESMGPSDFKSRTYPFNFQGERISIAFELKNAISGFWRLSRLIIFAKTQWRDVPK